MTLNFIYWDSIIGEIQIRSGSKPVHYEANHVLYELARADTVSQMKMQVFVYLEWLAEMKAIYKSHIPEELLEKRKNELE